MRLPLRLLSRALFAFGLCLSASGSPVVTQPASAVPPKRVLLLPLTDATAEGTNMLASRSVVIRHRLQAEFLSRGFAVGGEQCTEPAGLAARQALSEPRPKSAEVLDELARRAGADWLVRVIVESASADPGREADFEVATRLHLQIRDAAAHVWLYNGPYTARAAGAGSPVMVFLRSLDAAITEVLAVALAAHPRRVELPLENSLVDYVGTTSEYVTVGTMTPSLRADASEGNP